MTETFQERYDQALRLLAGPTPAGREFLKVAAQAISKCLNARWAGVVILKDGGQRVSVLMLLDDGQEVDPFAFDLAGSPCETVYQAPCGEAVCYPCDAAGRFPEFRLLDQLGVAAYRGEAFYQDGEPVGHVLAMHDAPLEDSPSIDLFFRLVSQRVGAEYHRWRAEEALSNIEEILRHSLDLSAIVNSDHVYEYVSPAYSRIFQRDASDIIGSPVSKLLPNYEKVLPSLDLALNGQVCRHVLGIDTSHSEFWVDTHMLPAGTPDNRRVIVISRDFTKRKQAEDAITELLACEDAIAGDMESVCRRIGEVVRETVGYPQTDFWLFKDQSTMQRVAESPNSVTFDYESLFLRAIQSAEETQLSVTDPEFSKLQTLGLFGDTTVTSVKAVPVVCNDSVEGVMICCGTEECEPGPISQVDMKGFSRVFSHARENRVRRDLKKRIAQGQQLESLGLLAGGIAHDLNNLLVPVLVGVENALKANLTGNTKRGLELALTAVRESSEFCDQVLSLSGKQERPLEPVDLSEIPHRARMLLKLAADAKHEVIVHPGVSALPIRGDEARIRQAIVNLVSNASEAMAKPGTIEISCGAADSVPPHAVTAEPIDAERYCWFRVQDEGCGMSAEMLERALEPFYSTRDSGRGLGLAIVLGAVRAHQGALVIDTEPGQGTTFTVYFPETQSPLENNGQPSDGTGKEFSSKTLSVLIVDDNPFVRTTTSTALESMGHTVTAVNRGPDAIERVKTDRFDVALIDVQMPMMNGYETRAAINKVRPELPIVMMSGYANDLQRFQDVPFLRKPFNARALVNTLQNASIR